MTTPPTSFPEPGPDVRLALALTWEEAQQGVVKSVIVDGRTEEVRVPPGATDGRELRLPGRGGPSPSGGPAGALLVMLQVPPATVRGGDIRRTLRLTWEEAQRGVVKPLTVNGQTMDVPVAPGATDGREIRRPGAGSPGLNGGPPGDLVVTLQVMPEQSQNAPPAWSRSNQGLEPTISPAPTFPPSNPPSATFPPTPFPPPVAPTFPSQQPFAAPYDAPTVPGPQGPQRGGDVRVDLPLTVAQAITGGPQSVMVNEQRLEVPVPYGAVNGQELRRAGAGLPGLNGGPPGDLVVIVRVTAGAAPIASPRSGARWLVPAGAIAAVIILGLIAAHFMHPGQSGGGGGTNPAASTLDYSQMQFWKTLPPPGGTANAQNPDSAYAMAFTSPDTLAVGYFPNTGTNSPQVLLWNVPNTSSASPGDLNGTTWLNAHDLAVSPNGQDIAVGGFDSRASKNVLAIYSITGSLVKYFTVGPGGAAGVTAIAYSPNGKFVAVSCGDVRNRPGIKGFTTAAKPKVKSNVSLWDASGTQDTAIASGDGGDAWCVGFTPDTSAVAYGETQYVYQYPLHADGTIAADHPTVVCDRQDATQAIISALYSSDGQSLYVIARTNTGADDVQKLNAKTGVVVMAFLDKTGSFAYSVVQKLALSPDGRCLAAAGVDNQRHDSITFWDTQTGALIGQPQLAHDNQIYTLAFSPDGKALACGSNDGTVKLWHIP